MVRLLALLPYRRPNLHLAWASPGRCVVQVSSVSNLSAQGYPEQVRPVAALDRGCLEPGGAEPMTERLRHTVPSQPSQASIRLVGHLLDTSRAFLTSAMQAYARDDHLPFYLNAGIALEHLLKARLATVSPTLIADCKHFESMLTLATLGDTELPPPSLRTITFTETFQRCKHVIPALQRLEVSLRTLVAYRNGAAHAGVVDRTKVPSDLASFAEVVELVLPDLGTDRDAFAGEFRDTLRGALDRSKTDVEIETSAAIANARLQFLARFPHSAPGYNVEEALAAMTFPDKYDTQRFECPACGHSALLHGESEPDWSVREDASGSSFDTTLRVWFFPSSMECLLCGLSLDGRGLVPAGLPLEIELTDFDPEDFGPADMLS